MLLQSRWLAWHISILSDDNIIVCFLSFTVISIMIFVLYAWVSNFSARIVIRYQWTLNMPTPIGLFVFINGWFIDILLLNIFSRCVDFINICINQHISLFNIENNEILFVFLFDYRDQTEEKQKKPETHLKAYTKINKNQSWNSDSTLHHIWMLILFAYPAICCPRGSPAIGVALSKYNDFSLPSNSHNISYNWMRKKKKHHH